MKRVRQVVDTQNKTLENWHWPYKRINFDGAKEYSCPHGIGHGGIHGCDGCCNHESFKKSHPKI